MLSDRETKTTDDDDVLIGFDPMNYDFKLSALSNWVVGEDDPVKSKDFPCKFHDGFSGSCWKGSNCPHSHKIYSGGVFAKENPVWSAAASCAREVAGTLNLTPEAILKKAAHVNCVIVHVESPSEFFIRPINGPIVCGCTFNIVGGEAADQKGKQMDDYFYGFNLLEAQEGLNFEQTQGPHATKSLGMQERLSKFLSFGRHQDYQFDIYFEEAELVAVKVRFQWNRAVLKRCNEDGTFRVLLMDIGETLIVAAKDICRLPYKFCGFPPEVYKCCLYGVSPIIRRWDSMATNTFKDLIKDKRIMIVVQKGVTTGNFSILEEFPYYVKMLASSDQEHINVSNKLVDLEVALRWSRQ